MSLTSVGAIYATGSLLLQRIYVPSFDDDEINQQPLHVGESVQLVPLQTWQSGGVGAVQAAIGTPSHSGRCAIVNVANTVTAVIRADPAVYHSPNIGVRVIQHDFAAVGDLWTGTNFTRLWAEADKVTGLVVAVTTQDVVNAVPANAVNFLMPAVGPSAVLKVGDAAPIAAFKLG